MASPPDPSYVEIEDLVRLSDTGRLAFVERVAGDSSDEDDSFESDEDDSDTSSITDERGRLTRWVQGMPGVSGPSTRVRDSQGRQLISAYDDEKCIATEEEFDELPSAPDDSNGTTFNDTSAFPRELPDGHAVIVQASTGEKVLKPVSQLEVIDRNFDPGQTVSWAPGRAPPPVEGKQQSGLVEHVYKRVTVRRVRDITPSTVQIPDPATCFEISTKQLGFFSGVRSGDTVVRGSWVGAVDYFQEDVFVEFSDGCIACVPGHRKALQSIDRRTPEPIRTNPFSEGLFYPGQRVRSLPEVWKTIALWIRGSYSGEDEGTVKFVKIGDLGVEFVAKSLYASGNEDNSYTLDGHERGVEVVPFSDVTLLESFRDLWWAVGDRGFLIDSQSESKEVEKKVDLGTNDISSVPSIPVPIDDDEEWEEDDATSLIDVGSSSTSVPLRLPKKNRSRKQGGRLMKAHRKARERNGMHNQIGAVSDAAFVHASANPDDVVQVVLTRSLVDVLWQDGTRSSGLPTVDLRIYNYPDPFDFWPGEIVTSTSEEVYVHAKGVLVTSERKGVIIRVDQSDRTAIVKWQRIGGSEFEVEEEVSVYELKTDEYDVSIGDTVMRVPQDSSTAEKTKDWVGVVTRQHMGNCTVVWNDGSVSSIPTRGLLYISGGEDDETFETAISETDLQSEGGGAPSGQGSGTVVPHVPQDPAYYRNWGSDDDGEKERLRHMVRTAYGCTVISGLLSSPEVCRFRRDLEGQVVEAAIKKATEEITKEMESKRFKSDGSLLRRSISKREERVIAAGFTFFVLGEVFSQTLGGSNIEDGISISPVPPPYQEWAEFIEKVQMAFYGIYKSEMALISHQTLSFSPPEFKGNEIARTTSSPQQPSLEGQGSEVADKAIIDSGKIDNCASLLENLSHMQRFGLVDSIHLFHHFGGTSHGPGHRINFLSVVHKEWNRLRNHLPAGIFVRASESELGRLRAGIVGPQDTPYADVMFFFDIQLGEGYPMSPPDVFFHSFGRRLNPNLYEDGKVCLSILGTWDGDDVESWDAKTSNLLRVLLSLQALVFVEEPYYNEAGYDKQRDTPEGRVNSRMYNESAFLLSMRYIIQSITLLRIANDCKDVADVHYREVGNRIVERCKGLLQAQTETEADKAENNGNHKEDAPYSSSGFKKSLNQMLKALETAVYNHMLENES